MRKTPIFFLLLFYIGSDICYEILRDWDWERERVIKIKSFTAKSYRVWKLDLYAELRAKFFFLS